ncbi:uncharacterized protein LOC101455089 [Ceratitis capitata]|uniref:uncharacterized protein LOC101455089 n=1 Tax=Ceratitis capitata TaxID=7213 RepID=UPI0003298847|nr:uncharacterized protein LOC101455089 [Ceratitis capitata]
MFINKTLFVLVIIACTCLSFGLVSSLKCYSCTSVEDCKKAKKLECTYDLANKTLLNHLNFYYLNVPTANTTNSLQCLRDWLQTPQGPVEHKGCIYSGIYSCTYAVRPQFQRNSTRVCHQCQKDGCNPAGRANVNLPTVALAIMMLLLFKFAWRK